MRCRAGGFVLIAPLESDCQMELEDVVLQNCHLVGLGQIVQPICLTTPNYLQDWKIVSYFAHSWIRSAFSRHLVFSLARNKVWKFRDLCASTTSRILAPQLSESSIRINLYAGCNQTWTWPSGASNCSFTTRSWILKGLTSYLIKITERPKIHESSLSTLLQ
jgi:hypothetical protein